MEDHSALLRLVRAVTVLDGIDVDSTRHGVLVGASDRALVGWPDVYAVLAGDDPLDQAPRLRLTLLLAMHQRLAALGTEAGEQVHRCARLLALPTGHPLRPDPDWVQQSVPGGVLELGVGVAGLLPDQDGVLPLPSSVARAAGFDRDSRWHTISELGARSAQLSCDRLLARSGRRDVLLGSGGCDALTALAIPAVRARLTGVVAAPSRDRVWVGPQAADPGYLRAVWTLTAAARRGVLEPLAVDAATITPVRPARG